MDNSRDNGCGDFSMKDDFGLPTRVQKNASSLQYNMLNGVAIGTLPLPFGFKQKQYTFRGVTWDIVNRIGHDWAFLMVGC
jgi:hypothetical protein